MKKDKKTIFIHSLFRTGSTYIWNKFRQKAGYYCYYEPLHPLLSQVSAENIEIILTRDFQSVHHPVLDNYYLYEYKPLLKNNQAGVPFFKKSFSCDEFCRNDPNPEMKQYIDYLLAGAGKKVPLLQFNRTALRTRWFKTNYPGSLNIYLVRNPRDQWQSYFELYKRTNFREFFLMDLLLVSVNEDKEDFKALSRHLPFLPFNHRDFEKEKEFYYIILDSYSNEEKYLIFYYTWLRSLVENVLNADLVLNMNLLSQKPTYRTSVKNFLLNYAIDDIEFEDANLKEYSSYLLPKHKMDKIEAIAQEMIVQALDEDLMKLFFEKIPGEDRKYFQFSKDDFNEKRKIEIKYNIQEKSIEKFRNMLFLFFNQFLQQKEVNAIVKTGLHQNEPQVAEIARQLSEFLKEFNQELMWRDELLRRKGDRSFHEDRVIKEMLDEKHRQLGLREELLNKRDEQMTKMEQMLNKKSEENHQQLALKHELLAQRFEQSTQKEQAMKKLVEEKDRQLADKDSLLRKNDEDLLQKEQEWREKLKEKEVLLLNKERHLKDLTSRLSEKENQLSQKDNYIRLIFNSYTYRTGKLLLFPFIKLTGWMKKNKKKVDKND